MNLAILKFRVGISLAVGIPTTFAASHLETDVDLRRQVEEAVAKIKEGRSGQLAVLAQLGKDAIPILIDHVDDDNADVRGAIACILAESLDERAIPALVERLLVDDNPNVWDEAVGGLCRYPMRMLKKQSFRKLLDALGTHAGRWDRTSYKAVLLIGDLRVKSKVDDLRKILLEAREIQGEVTDEELEDEERVWETARMGRVLKMKRACVEALFKLGDEKATRKVRASLKRDDAKSIAFGIEAVAYAGKKHYVKELLPFLDDDRVAIKPPGWPSYLRVKDIALNAIVQLSGIQPSFRLQTLVPYKDEQVGEVKKLIRAPKTK